MTTVVKGKVSHFGGPDDRGVGETEGLALVKHGMHRGKLMGHLFANVVKGLARGLNPETHYIAMRWNYSEKFAEKNKHRDLVPVITPVSKLRRTTILVVNSKTGQWSGARPVDWGPNENTGRVADISPGLMRFLGLKTDDMVTCVIDPKF